MRKILTTLLILLVFLPAAGQAQQAFLYGPTVENEHLYRIAMAVRPSAGLTIQQTMIAILRANPYAFRGGNINALKAGYRLRIPSFREIQSIPLQNAFLSVRRQNLAWQHGAIGESYTRHKNVHHQNEVLHGSNQSRPEVLATSKNVSNHKTSTSLAELVKNKKAIVGTTNSSTTDSTQIVAPTPNTTTSIATSSQNTQTDAHSNSTTPANAIQITQEQMDKINTFIKETNTFKESTTSRLNNLDNQYKNINTQLDKLEQEFRSLTYHVIKMINQNPANSWHAYLTQLQTGFNKYGLNLLIGLAIFTMLLILSLRLKRHKARSRLAESLVGSGNSGDSIGKKDEYDFMGSREAIPTKLDLARAYIDMGDYQNAKDALNEVVQLGNLQQKKEAHDLLAKIPNL